MGSFGDTDTVKQQARIVADRRRDAARIPFGDLRSTNRTAPRPRPPMPPHQSRPAGAPMLSPYMKPPRKPAPPPTAGRMVVAFWRLLVWGIAALAVVDVLVKLVEGKL